MLVSMNTSVCVCMCVCVCMGDGRHNKRRGKEGGREEGDKRRGV